MEFEDMAQNAQKRDLSPKQAAFVLAYLKCKNATQAAKEAGYKGKYVDRQAWEMLENPRIKAALDEELNKQSKRLRWDADRTLLEIERLASFDPKDLIGVKCPEDIANLPEDVRRAVVGWSWDKMGNFVVKLAKETALGMLAKHYGLMIDRVQHSGNITLESLLIGDEPKA